MVGLDCETPAGLAVMGAVVWAVWGIATPFVFVLVIEAVLT